MTAREQWRPIPGWEGSYDVSDHGRVRSYRQGGPRVLGGRRALTGHILISLRNGPIRKDDYAHRLVLLAFVGPCPPGHEVCHADDVPDNNKLSNLRYGTRSDNIADSIRNGRHASAKKTHCAQGHPWTEANICQDGRQRRCLICLRRQQAAYRAAKRLRRSLIGDEETTA